VLERAFCVPNDADGPELDEFLVESANASGQLTYVYSTAAAIELCRSS